MSPQPIIMFQMAVSSTQLVMNDCDGTFGNYSSLTRCNHALLVFFLVTFSVVPCPSAILQR